MMAGIGKKTPRVDGALKVRGGAMYTSDHHFPGMVYAVPVCSTIANGEILGIDTGAAEKMPGIRAIFHRGNIGRLSRAAVNHEFGAGMSRIDETRAPLEDDVIRYYGQYGALAGAGQVPPAARPPRGRARPAPAPPPPPRTAPPPR